VQLSGRLAIRYEPLISQVRPRGQQCSPSPAHCIASSAACLRRIRRIWAGFHPQARSQSTPVQSPIVAAVSCFFVNDPTIDFDLTGLLNVGDMPVLSGIIRKVLR